MAKKTKKYFMEVVIQDVTISEQIELTKKQYTQRYMDFQKFVQSEEFEFEFEDYEQVFESKSHTETRTRLTCGITDIYLIKYECKEGYYFIK